jgi:hypothetical protein
MKGGITKRLDEVNVALDKGQLKKALTLTDIPRLERHHEWVVEAARTCLENKDKPKACKEAIKVAKEKVLETMTLPEDSTDIEGLEEYLKPASETIETPAETVEDFAGKTDEELFEECIECHVADAVVKFHEIAEKCGDELTVARIDKQLATEPPPEKWMEELGNIAAEQSCGTESYKKVMGDLTGYLEKRDSPLLKTIDA